MCRHTPDAINEALADSAISKLRHDAQNKLTAFKLTTQLMERVNDPAKRNALRSRAEEQLALWETAYEEYQAALRGR